jgi:hypothetical protein
MRTRWFHVVARVCKILGLYRLILDREEKRPYLHRYYLLQTRWLGKWFPKLSYRIVLHNCVLSDEDGLHDHPWDWKSKVLAGGYWEHTPEGEHWRGPEGGWRSRKASDFHRLVLDPDCQEETWSLFVMGPKKKEWGFLDKDGQWVPWYEYISNRQTLYS